MDFATIEQTEGARFVWNTLPTSRLQSSKYVIPMSMLYTPFFQREEPVLRLESSPLICGGCSWQANPYCTYDYASMRWDCVNCGLRSSLPSYYKNYVAEGHTIPEFEHQNSIIEYQVKQPRDNHKPLIYFVIDTCVYENELQKVKQELIKNIELLGEVYVGIITVGKHVCLHDLANEHLTELVVPGGTEYKKEKLFELLHLKVPNQPTANRFVQPLSLCKDKLLKIIKRIKADSFVVGKNERPLRGSGQAFFAAMVIGESVGVGGRIIGFIGGSCTYGPGKVISNDLAETFRSHADLEKDSTAISAFKAAQKHYDMLTENFVKTGFTVDLFAFSLDQFGCAEMRNMVQQTGGIIVNQEEFTSPVFEKSLTKYMQFIVDETSVFSGQMKVFCSKDLFVSGALGPLKLQKKSNLVPKDAEGLIGEAGGHEFYIGAPLSTSTYLFFFSHSNPELNVKSKPCYFQITTSYKSIDGSLVMRVATFNREFVNDMKSAISGFDQEAAIATLARLAVYKGELIEVVDLVYWLNSVLIKFVRTFATFTKGNRASFKVPEEISLIPQFMFYFRKSHFVQKFGISVDEAALYKMVLCRENLSNMLVMIQPALFSYDLETQQPTPVLCDMESLKPDVVLLVDTYFNVVIWQGAQIYNWVKQGYHEMEEYAHLKNLLEQPEEDAKLIVEDRLPVPRVVSCYPGAPDERLLKSKLNPASAQKGNEAYQQDENYITDDVNLKVFMDYLVDLVVRQD